MTGGLRRLLGRRARDERGSITPFVLIVSLGFLLLAALVIDGGRQMNSKGRAVAYAQEAARAGAQGVDVTDPTLDLIPALAMGSAQDYCDQAMASDPQLTTCRSEIVPSPDMPDSYSVRVRTEVEIDAIMLNMFGRQTLTSSGAARARPVSGISEADQGKVPTAPPPTTQVPGEGDISVIPSGEPTDEGTQVPSCKTPKTDKPPKDGGGNGGGNGGGDDKGDKRGEGGNGDKPGGDDDKPNKPDDTPSTPGPKDCITETPSQDARP